MSGPLVRKAAQMRFVNKAPWPQAKNETSCAAAKASL